MRRELLVFCLLGLVVSLAGACASSTSAPQGRDLGGNGGDVDFGGGGNFDQGIPDLAPPSDLKKAGFGEPCSDPGQCETNICLLTSKGGVCTDFCPAIGCPAGYGCYDVLGAIDPGQVTRVCVPETNVLCTPCTGNSECGAPSGADKCLNYPSGKFCARDCSRISCPATYTCKTVDDGTGAMVQQCVPTNDACDCNAGSVGRMVACTIPTVNGACTGSQTCNGTTGWGTCQPPSTTDAPDLNFVDSNCDGIDGTEANAIFVDGITGSNANPGTKALPKQTIQAGVDAAAAGGKKDVYISKGTYSTTTILLASGVNLYGGYDAAMNWKRSLSNLTRISSTTTTAIASPAGNPRLNAIELQLLTITARGTTSAGASSYGIRIANGVGLTVRGCDITAGDAGAGSVGAKGNTGTKGGDGGDAVGTTKGAAGTSTCSVGGGAGADGINSDGGGAGNTGGSGSSVTNGGGAGSGGVGGSGGSCSTTSSSSGGSAPTSTAAPPFGPFPGSSGGPGQNGSSGAALGALDSSGLFTAAKGGDGLSSGYPGGGGGGGGSGGGSANGTNGTCTNCSAIPSGGGGGGGAGGCGGTVGRGGNGGGGSFAIAASGTPVTVEDSSLSTGFGGNGGDGGDGGDPGPPGLGGNAAGGGSRGGCCVTFVCGSSRQAGDGANGRQGGSGGRGGAGSGGPGGPSICVFYRGTPSTLTRTTCVSGGAGGVGTGGTNGQFRAPSGTTGIVDVTRASP